MQPFCDRFRSCLQAWGISFQLKFLFIVWQRFFCDWWNPSVSTMCHYKSASVKHRQIIVRLRSWTFFFKYQLLKIVIKFWYYATLRVSSLLTTVWWWLCLLTGVGSSTWTPSSLFCSLMNLTSVVSTSASTTAFGTSELKILNTDSSGSSP